MKLIQKGLLISSISFFFVSTYAQAEKNTTNEREKLCIEYYNETKKILPDCKDVIEIKNGKAVTKKLKLETKNITNMKESKQNYINLGNSYYEDFKKLDKDLGDFWYYLNKQLDSNSRKKLLNEQLYWIKNKDLKCELKINEEYPPKNYNKIFCLSEETKKRMEVLKNYIQFGYK